MVLALTITLPVAFAVGIATREGVTTTKAGALEPGAGIHNHNELWSRNDLWEKGAIQTRLLRTDPDSGQLAIELLALDQIVRPDLLVYWVPGQAKIENSLPGDAFLLGSFEQSMPTPLTLPAPAAQQAGALVLYSLADQELIAVSKPFAAK
jgi:hypothetical protein